MGFNAKTRLTHIIGSFYGPKPEYTRVYGHYTRRGRANWANSTRSHGLRWCVIAYHVNPCDRTCVNHERMCIGVNRERVTATLPLPSHCVRGFAPIRSRCSHRSHRSQQPEIHYDLYDNSLPTATLRSRRWLPLHQSSHRSDQSKVTEV